VVRARDLVGARGVAILLRVDDGLRVAAQAGELPADVRSTHIYRGVRASLGLSAAEGLLVPLVHQGRSLGMLAAWGPRTGGDDERLLRSFAVHAATAVANARRVEARRLHDALHAAEAERTRWARELHDATLQGLGALRLLLVAGRRARDPERLARAVDDAIERLEDEIHGLRGLVRELRPAALDELGLGPALEGLAERVRGIPVTTDVRISRRLSAELETAVYRIAQEALNNAVHHGDPSAVAITVRDREGAVKLEVRDDGRGFDPDAPAEGFGLIGMRERVALLEGALEVDSSPGGTRVVAALPVT
jgi:signal transduction histidine kinase